MRHDSSPQVLRSVQRWDKPHTSRITLGFEKMD
jgi:hypothetical protein